MKRLAQFVACGVAALLVGAALRAVAADDAPPRSEAAPADPAFQALLADPEVGPVLLKAVACREAGSVDEALDLLREANAAIKKKRGASHPDQLPILDLAAEILIGAGRFADAVKPLERTIALRETLVSGAASADHQIALASSLLLLGKAYGLSGSREPAVKALTRAIELFRASLGDDHEATVRAREELLAVQAEQ